MDKSDLKKRFEELRKNNKLNESSYPSTLDMAKNLVSSISQNVKSVVSGNDLKLSEAEANARLRICKGCEFFDQSYSRCKKCGCLMAIKTYLKAEKCPIGKW